MPPAPRPRPRSVRLSEIADLLSVSVEPASAAVEITGVTLDSNDVRPGDLFAALPGHSTHGARFAAAAAEAGAAALLTDSAGAEVAAGLGIPILVVENPRSWLGGISALAYGYPGAAMQLIGITGTNGKTTVAAMVESGLRASGQVTGMIGTVGIRIADRTFTGSRTTPEATDLHAILGVMAQEGVTSVVMEVSSIAIDEDRVNGVIYDIAAFTNLSQDHLDYHGTMESYFTSKSRLFHPTRSRHAVIGVEDAWGARLAADCSIPFETWSTVSSAADWTVESLDATPVAVGPDGERQALKVPLPGRFNVANAVCAYAILRRAGISESAAAQGISAASVPGRMQVVGAADDVMGIVDYAHSPDAIERVLEALRSTTTGRVIAVVGAGGDRDRGKRSQMGAIAARLADVVVITDDNPRYEDPASIRASIRAGALEVAADHRAELHEHADRHHAIVVAVDIARPGDVVVVLGKGHEQGQESGGAVTPFDDATELAGALADRQSR